MFVGFVVGVVWVDFGLYYCVIWNLGDGDLVVLV